MQLLSLHMISFSAKTTRLTMQLLSLHMISFSAKRTRSRKYIPLRARSSMVERSEVRIELWGFESPRVHQIINNK